MTVILFLYHYSNLVPGGVGPMTVAMLISNTVDSAKRVSDARK